MIALIASEVVTSSDALSTNVEPRYLQWNVSPSLTGSLIESPHSSGNSEKQQQA